MGLGLGLGFSFEFDIEVEVEVWVWGLRFRIGFVCVRVCYLKDRACVVGEAADHGGVED